MGYPNLPQVLDPAVARALKVIGDRLNALTTKQATVPTTVPSLTATLDAGGQRFTDLAGPVALQDGVTHGYATALIEQTLAKTIQTVKLSAPKVFGPVPVGPFTPPPLPPPVVPSPTPPPLGPPPAPPPNPGLADQIDLSTVQIVNSFDVRSWPITANIRQVVLQPTNTSFVVDGLDAWPDMIPPGFTGSIQYTVWLFLFIGGHWVTSGFIQMWRGRQGTGDGVFDYANNWYYSPRWAPMYGHGPIHNGEQIGFMLTAGNARDSGGGRGQTQQRSQSVIVTAAANATYSF